MAERALLLRGGSVVDRSGTYRADVLIADGVVQAVGADLETPARAVELDCGGCYVGASSLFCNGTRRRFLSFCRDAS